MSAAEPPPGEVTEGVASEIVVEGRTEEAVERFVEALTQNERGKQIARWNSRICPRILGLVPGQASYISARIAAVARSLKIPVSSDNCRGNIIIVVSEDADNFTRILIRRYPRLFGDPRDSLASRAEIALLLQPRPVRWIAASTTVNADGTPIFDGQPRNWSASRLTMPTRENARFSFIIVDGKQLDHIILSQLADYLTMVTLARPTLDASYDASTIMSLFRIRDEGGQAPKRLTPMDLRLLKALYATNPATTAPAQRSTIRRDIKRNSGSPDED